MYKIIIITFLFLVSCNKQELEPIIYPFKGVIIDIFQEEQKMMIKHDEVSGFMMEMTMMFNLDPSINISNYACYTKQIKYTDRMMTIIINQIS